MVCIDGDEEAPPRRTQAVSSRQAAFLQREHLPMSAMEGRCRVSIERTEARTHRARTTAPSPATKGYAPTATASASHCHALAFLLILFAAKALLLLGW